MGRLEIFDGLRGYFLVFMLINHLTFTGGSILLHVNHAELGFVQDAQGFVFLSGLLVGMVYARRMAKDGFRQACQRMWKRALELYAYAMGCLVVILLLSRLLHYSWVFWGAWLGQLIRGDLTFKVAAATLLYQPTFMDILPQYIFYLMAAPPLVWLCLNGRFAYVAIGSLLLWFAVQVGLHLPLVDGADHVLGGLRTNLTLRAGFDPLAWQLLFVAGLVLGALSSTRQLDWRRVFGPSQTMAIKAALAFLVFFAALRLAETFDLLSDDVMARLAFLERRAEFGPIGMLNFAALAYAVGWILMAGPMAEASWVRRLAGWLTALFSLPALRLLGRHSLQVYAFHVVIIYLMRGLDWHYGPFSNATKILLTGFGLALLTLPALLREMPLGQMWRPRVMTSR
ncbi:hypothetical protein SAMN07250955_107178 [Arboricoccus pini]|uniref:OpgC protein n=1 Tax=Arboricoccus pini TaxID=1963835 RepID=A0A212RDZ9_9PROT|nr:OpgC domain-containing protein [Arboricoccus pini]SNB70359.1 hypothetical protein SAMN07250955_107178 [Arboricoccus pini]